MEHITYYFERRERSHNNIIIGCIVLFVVLLTSCKKETTTLTKLSGSVFGTSYNILYNSEKSYDEEVNILFNDINNSMSTYIKDSDISKINRNEAFKIDQYFKRVLYCSYDIYKLTEGAFDPTIGVVVNAWDFGPQGKIEQLDSLKIDSLMQYVGLKKVIEKGNTILKPEGTFIDFNAIAKGYAVDLVAELLEQKGVANYLVEIGGEIRTKGINTKKQGAWTVGVQRPRFDGVSATNDYLVALPLKDEAMATSGSYRKFKIDDDGNRYTHIIDTKTGYPSKTNVLSVSVIAQDCMTADAYATAFKAMGIEKVKMFLKNHPELKVFFIFENEKKEFEMLALNGFPL